MRIRTIKPEFWRSDDIADRAAEEARIIERYRNHDPLDYLAPLRNRD